MLSLKKIVLMLLVIAGFAACSSRKNELKSWMEGGQEPRVLSTVAQIGDLVSQIGGERVRSIVLVVGDLDPHSYELVKGDGEKFERAELIFYNGLGLEHGASLAARLQGSVKAVAVGEKIATLYPERILKRGGVTDPHLWMDVSLWSHSIEIILQELIRIDPDGRDFYRARADALLSEMEQIHREIKEKMIKIPSERRYLMTSHDAFRYFARTYLANEGEIDWMSRFAAPEGLAPDGQLNPHDIQQMIEFLKKRRVSVIFPESNVSRDSIQKVAAAGREMGIEVRVSRDPLYGDSTNGLSYLDSMRSNGQVLESNL